MLRTYHHPEGRIANISTGSNSPVLRYEYSLRDHLGNSRVSFSDISQLAGIEYDDRLQTNTYYPYGSTIAPLSSSNQFVPNDYKYNNIELVDDLGLNLHLADYRAYDALTGRWTGVDPKPNPAISTYAAMGCNPVRYMDPRGDTTYVYDKIGHFKDIVYGKLPTEIHFTDDIEGCSNDANSLEELIRKKSFAYLTRYQTKKIQKISTLSEKEQLERLFVLIKPHNSRELSVEDITTFLPKGARKGSGESQLGFGEIGEGFDDAVKTAKYVFYGNVFAVGHTHVRNAIKYALHDVQRPSYPNDEPQAGMNDFISVLPAPHLAIIAGHYGISFYTTGLEKRYVVNGEVLGSQSYTSSPAFSWDYFNYKLKNFQTFGRE